MYPLWAYHATVELVVLSQPLDIPSLQDQCHQKCRQPVAAIRKPYYFNYSMDIPFI